MADDALESDTSAITADPPSPRITPTPSESPLFRGEDVVAVRLEASLAELFAMRGQQGLDENNTPKVSGKLSYVKGDGGTASLDVDVNMRGNTSLTECAFPKLTLKLTSPTAGTIFEHAKKVKIGTHCGETVGMTQLGRLANQLSPHREAFAYRMLSVLGVPSLAARPARITYVDTGSGAAAGPLERDAFFLEDIDSLAKRLGGAELDIAPTTRWPVAPAKRVGMANLARVFLAENLLGNWDFGIDFDAEGEPPHNVKVVRRPEGVEVAVPYDFDMASIVTSTTRIERNVGREFAAEQSPVFRQIASKSLESRALFRRETIRPVARELASKKNELLRALEQFPMDDEGKANARAHIEAGAAALADASFLIPLTMKDGLELKAAATPDSSVQCDGISKGEPMMILEERGALLRVHLLYDSCTTSPAEGWIAANAVDR